MEDFYSKADFIFLSQRKKEPIESKKFNFYGRFLCFKAPNIMVLKDDSKEEIHFYVRFLNSKIIEKFKSHFRPWFLFRFQEAYLTSALSAFDGNPKILNFNGSDPNSIVVFDLIKLVNTETTKFHVSQNPIITELDWKIVQKMQLDWCNEIQNTSFRDLQRNLITTKKPSTNITFMAQLIEIKQVSPRLMIIKAWDGTTPDFPFSFPINQTTIQQDQIETNNTAILALSDSSLDKLVGNKKVYIVAYGENAGKFYNRKPKDLVLIFNAQFCSPTKYKPYRIELTKPNRDGSVWVKNLEKDTNLGISLLNKIKHNSTSTTLHLPSDLMKITSIEETIVARGSIQQNQAMNQIFHIDSFANLEQLKNYEMICSIKDVYPLEYTVFDLINLKCTACGLDESTENLFGIDLDGLRRATKFYLTQYGLDRKEIVCTSCHKPTAYFKYKIIFLLEDSTGKYLISSFDGIYAEGFFKTKPIEVLADETKEFIFKNKFEELKKIFDCENGYPTRSMIIFRDAEIYKIKAINFKRNLI